MEDWTHTTSLTISRIIEAPYRKKESQLLCIYIKDVEFAYCDIFVLHFIICWEKEIIIIQWLVIAEA